MEPELRIDGDPENYLCGYRKKNSCPQKQKKTLAHTVEKMGVSGVELKTSTLRTSKGNQLDTET
jgi:hypothetical protein